MLLISGIMNAQETGFTLTSIVMKDLNLDKLRILYSQRDSDESAKF